MGCVFRNCMLSVFMVAGVASTASEAMCMAGSVQQTSRPPDHMIFDELLRNFVNARGDVDYAGLNKHRDALEQYLSLLSTHPPESDWSAEERKAYWINAYNAFTLKLIIDHYPVTSIRDIHAGNPWAAEWIKIGPKTYSLNQIEHEQLRPVFQDARIHFAVNCAAASCPPLLNRAYLPATLDQQLDRVTAAFINNAVYNRITSEKAYVSQIFNWYHDDFGDLHTYLNRYTASSISPAAVISFQEYDWSLNSQ